MAELREVIGVQRKAQTARPCRGMDKGCNAAMRVEDECKPPFRVWRDIRTSWLGTDPAADGDMAFKGVSIWRA